MRLYLPQILGVVLLVDDPYAMPQIRYQRGAVHLAQPSKLIIGPLVTNNLAFVATGISRNSAMNSCLHACIAD